MKRMKLVLLVLIAALTLNLTVYTVEGVVRMSKSRR